MDKKEKEARNLRDIVLEYCENALVSDRPTKNMCRALDQFDQVWGKPQ